MQPVDKLLGVLPVALQVVGHFAGRQSAVVAQLLFAIPDHLVRQLIGEWGSGEAARRVEADAPKEAFALSLNIDKARTELDWRPVWEFNRTVAEVAQWYKTWLTGDADMREVTLAQIARYEQDATAGAIAWAC